METQDKLIDLYDENGKLKDKTQFLTEISKLYDTCAATDAMSSFDYLDYITTSENQINVTETYSTFNFLNRNFYIDDEITQEVANKFHQFVTFWNEVELIEGTEKEAPMPLNVYINSQGGDLDAALSIVSVMRSSKIPVHTIVYGRAWSGAFLIAICGTVRLAEGYATFLFHEGNALYGENAHKFIQFSDFYKQKILEIIRYITTHYTKITEQEYQVHKNDDWWFTANDALDFGLIDKIKEEKKK